ncbi:retrovirus-related pol polyprotein from transposon TNT 1-94 [Tanacetum coccineum]
MTLPSEHLLTFNQYKDAKTLFKAIETRFGGNEATKKTQKTLLKQMYENFNASSSESLGSIITRLQKISMHVVVWRNKSDMGSISFDDLYNNFKIVEQEVKRSVTLSSNLSSQNVAFVSTPGSSNEYYTANVQVNTASTNVSTTSSTDNTARLIDATIYAFLANQPNGSQVVHEDLEQIHEDDLEEMDLKWQLALLSLKARKFYQRTGKKIIINGSDTAGYDKSKVECFNCHKMGHFARECRGPRNQESRPRNQESRPRSQDSSRRTVNVEESSSKAMLAIDGVGFDWSFMTEEEIPTNFALMAFSDSEVHNNKTCSKTCLKSFEDLKSQYDNLRIELNKSEFDLANYKRGLAYVEEQLVFYKKNEERLKKEKESNQIKIDNFENASKSLDKLIGCQISDNNRKGVGYNVVAPPPTGLFAPPTIDLSNSGLEEFKQPEFGGYGVKVNKKVSENSSNEIKKTSSAPIIKDWVSDCDEDETLEKVSESANVQKPKQADQPRKISQNPRNNSTNWNTPMSKKLGDKKMVQKPVLNNVKNGTGQREVRPIWNNAMRTNHQNFSTYRSNFSPTAVLTNSGLVPISTARQSFSRAATSVSTAMLIKTAASKPFVNVVKSRPNDFQKSHSPSRRSFYQHTTLNNRNLNNRVNIVKVNSVNTAKGKRVISAVGEQGINDVKSKACWVWRPKIKVESREDIDDSMNVLSVLVVYHTTNGHQFTMSNRQERIGYSKANDNWIRKIDCLLSSELLFEGRFMMSIMHASILETFVGDEAVHKELGDRMERAATTASSFNTEQDSDAQTRFEATSKRPMIHLSQEVTHLEVGRTFDQERKEADDIDWSKIVKQAQKRQSGSLIRYQALRKKLVIVAQASGSEPSQEQSTEEQKELSKEDLKEMLEIVPVEESKAEALQVKYPIVDWEVHVEGSRKYWKIIRVGNITEAYQGFEDMLKGFDREDLDTL